MSYLLFKDQVQSGPFTLTELQAAIAEGSASCQDLVWKEGMTEWKPISAILPPPPLTQSNPPPLPPPLPAQRTSLLSGNTFLLAKINQSGSRNEYDVINVESGKVALMLREHEVSAGGKIARSGILDGWGGGQAFSKFSISLSEPGGAVYFLVRGGGIGGHSDVFKLSGEKIGEIKRTSLLNLHFEAYSEEGLSVKIISKGIGKLTSEQKLIDASGEEIGKSTDSGWSDANKSLGDKIRFVDSSSVLRSKYDYKHKIELGKNVSVKEKCFIFASMYQLSHVAGD